MIQYNTLSTSLKCPYCGSAAAHRVKLAFGETRVMGRYSLGDRYPWRPGLPVERGGRPIDGDFLGDSTSRCPVCHQVFNVQVHIHNDIIRSVEPGRTRQPYSQSRWLDGRIQAPSPVPEPTRSQLDDDLISRSRQILERIQKGEVSEQNSELCVLLYDLGEALRQKGQVQATWRAFNYARQMAARIELTGWSTITWEAIRELSQEYGLDDWLDQDEAPVQGFLAECLDLLQAGS